MPENDRGGLGKNPCESVEQEENHKEGPRWSWANNQVARDTIYCIRSTVVTGKIRKARWFWRVIPYMLTSDGVKWGGVRVSVREIVRAAYRSSPGRVIFPVGEPQEKYDFISTLSYGTGEALQRELKNTLGLVGRWETNSSATIFNRA